jgi:hypothetical protein
VAVRALPDYHCDEMQIETDMALPVFPNGNAIRTDCTCLSKSRGRTMIDGQWRSVCMRCGSLRENTGT